MNDKAGPDRWSNPHAVDNPGARAVSTALLRGEELRRKTAAGLALGTFLVELPAPSTLTAFALAGFDFVVLDMEHSAVDFQRLETLVAAGQAAGLVTLVRIWGEDRGLIGKVLDVGANGIMVPHVESVERARDVVEQARFAPRGGRGFSPLTRYDSMREPIQAVGSAIYIVLQIEAKRGLEQAGKIAAVPGVDAIFVGPYDLSLSLGVAPGSPQVFDAARKMAESVPKGTALGIYLDDPARCGEWAQTGFALQCVSFDGRMLAGAARSLVNQARQATKK